MTMGIRNFTHFSNQSKSNRMHRTLSPEICNTSRSRQAPKTYQAHQSKSKNFKSASKIKFVLYTP